MAIYMPDALAERQMLLCWAERRIGLAVLDYHLDRTARAVGIVRRAHLAAVAAYRQHFEADAELIIAIDDPRAITKQVIQFVLGWPFWTLPAAVVHMREARR